MNTISHFFVIFAFFEANGSSQTMASKNAKITKKCSIRELRRRNTRLGLMAVRMAMTLLFAFSAFAAEDVQVQVSLDPPVIPYHRQAVFTITVWAPKDVEVTLPNMVDRFGPVGVYGTPEYERDVTGEDRVKITERYVLDPVFKGDVAIPPVEVTWGEGGKTVVPSPGLRVRDLTEEERAEAEKFDAALADPVLPSSRWTAQWWVWASVAAVAVALAAAAWYYWRRPRAEFVEPKKTPWEVAYERLRVLDQRQYTKAGKYGTYYVDLSSILRYYIEDRFQVHAPEQTTPEFLADISARGLLTEVQERAIGTFLRHCDRVKFAQYQPALEEMERSLTTVLQFIDETVPAPEKEAAA